jgi:transcriptional regulator with XRE-family HTH domain
MSIAEALTKMRIKYGVSIATLVERSGLSESTVRRIFSGDTKAPSYDDVCTLVWAMGGTLEELYILMHPDRPMRKFQSEGDERQEAYRKELEDIYQRIHADVSQSHEDMEHSCQEMAQSRAEMAQSRDAMSQSRDEMSQSRSEMSQSRDEMSQSRDEMTQSRNEMTQSREEMTQSRNEMTQSRDEMKQSRSEMAQPSHVVTKSLDEPEETAQPCDGDEPHKPKVENLANKVVVTCLAVVVVAMIVVRFIMEYNHM